MDSGIKIIIIFILFLGLNSILRKRKVITSKFVTYGLILIFFIHFTIGIGYNIFFKADINKKIKTMTNILLNIKPINKYEIEKIKIAKTNAIISKSIESDFETKGNSKTIIDEFRKYLQQDGWKIKEYNIKIMRLEAEKNNYIFILFLKKENNNPGDIIGNISVHHDDLFYRYVW